MSVASAAKRKKAATDEPPLVKPGRILFYMPLTTRSMKLTYLPLAEALVARGHEVTVVMPHEAKSTDNLEVITIENDFMKVQEEGLKDLLEGAQIFGTLSGLVAAALSTNDKALSHPALRAHLDDPGARGFDVVLVSPFLASEAGYYLAHRFDAAQVVYVTVQASASFVDYAVGMPHNPAYLPMPMMPFLPPMTFLQRVVNTLASVAFQAGRDLYVVRQGEAILDKHFPGEDRPSLLDLERNTSLVLHYGHPASTIRPSSFQESLCHKKPLVATPIYGDEFANGQVMEDIGFGKSIEYNNLTEEGLYRAIMDVLEDPRYKEAASQRGDLLMDQITMPMDRAIRWLEFLMRHPGENHFHSPVHHLAWCKYLLLDVILFLAVSFFLAVAVPCKLLRWIFGPSKADQRAQKLEEKKRQ